MTQVILASAGSHPCGLRPGAPPSGNSSRPPRRQNRRHDRLHRRRWKYRLASTYGYDVRQPEEELFALGVLSLASASTLGVKLTAMTALSRLAQQMMRQAAWAELRRHLLVNAIDHTYKALSLTLTKKKLGQTVQVAGAVLNAGLNANLVNQAFRRAEAVYRLRFLSEKYAIDPNEWRRDSPVEPDGTEDIVRVDEKLEAEIEGEQGRESA